jgi:hypothetical protein
VFVFSLVVFAQHNQKQQNPALVPELMKMMEAEHFPGFRIPIPHWWLSDLNSVPDSVQCRPLK